MYFHLFLKIILKDTKFLVDLKKMNFALMNQNKLTVLNN